MYLRFENLTKLPQNYFKSYVVKGIIRNFCVLQNFVRQSLSMHIGAVIQFPLFFTFLLSNLNSTGQGAC